MTCDSEGETLERATRAQSAQLQLQLWVRKKIIKQIKNIHITNTARQIGIDPTAGVPKEGIPPRMMFGVPR